MELEYFAYAVVLNDGDKWLRSRVGNKYHTQYTLTADLFERDLFKTWEEARNAANAYIKSHTKKVNLNLVSLKLSEIVREIKSVE